MLRHFGETTGRCPLPATPKAAALSSSLVMTARRTRFYRPLFNHGQDKWDSKQVEKFRKQGHYMYRPIPMDPKPIPEPETNNLYGKKRMWNAIPSSATLAAKKHEEFGWPFRDPPPTGLRNSPEYFPYWFDKYFPDVKCRLVLDSVLNNETMEPKFHFPPDMSKQEIQNYLQNIHGFDNIDSVETRNFAGLRYKNEVGAIKQLDHYKEAVVTLDSPVVVELKQVKETADVGDANVKDEKF